MNCSVVRITYLLAGLVVLLASGSFGVAAQGERIIIPGFKDPLGFTKPVPVNVSGFTGEADSVLKNDLLFMGVQHVPLDQADYLVTGSNSGRVEGRVSDKAKRQIFAKAYTGSSTRAQIHALADDVAFLLTQLKGIAQTKVVFKAETRSDRSEVYLADYDGFNPQAVTHDQSTVAAPVWIGRSGLAYATYKMGNPHIYSHQLTTGARAAVARHPGGNYSPAVSPDGSRVAMILSKGGSPDLYVANIDGSGLRQLTKTREAEYSPCWSPDGKLICYGSRDLGAPLLFTISPSGGAPRRLATTSVSSPAEPDWSPDGRWIAFTSQMRTFQICIVLANGGSGGDAIALVEGEDPSWAPNSRALMFCRGPDHAKQLSLLDVPTKRVKHIARILGSNSQPSWAK